MKSYADLIPTGLLAMLGEDDEGLMLKEIRPQSQQAFPQAGGFGPQGGWGERAQKLPYIFPPQENFDLFAPSSAAAQGSHVRDFFNRYPLDQAPGPIESHIQLYSDKPQQAQGAQAGQEIPYYMVGRRPLNGLQHAYPTMPEAQDDVNSRFEHQHLWRSDGVNFGLTTTGKFSEQGGRNDYSFDVPGHESTRYKAKYIEEAERELDREWEEVERVLRGAKENFPMSDDIDAEMPRYDTLRYNCQDYVDAVIERAWKKAKMNNDSLAF